MDYAILIKFLQESLLITLPIEIRLNTRASNSTKELAGYCDTRMRKGKIIRFVIVINLDVCMECNYSIIGVIAHEAIHASMLEHNIFNDEKHHCKKFQEIARILETELQKLNIDTGPLYCPEYDVT